MKLDSALELIANRILDEGFEPFGEDLGAGYAGAIKRDSYGTETFVYLWQEPDSEFSVVTQFTSRRLHKDLRLSIKFDKLLKKHARSSLRKNLALEMSDGKIVGRAGYVREGVEMFDLRMQEIEIRGSIRDLLLEAEKKLKADSIYEQDS